MDRVAVLILFLQILPIVVASPDYGIPNTVLGTARILSIVTDASSYLDTMTTPKLVPASITQTAYSLPNIVKFLQQTGTTVSQDGNSVAKAIATLIESKSGNPANLFDAASKRIQDSLDHITQLLPSTQASLSALIGNNVPDRLADSFARLQIGLQTLLARLGTLKAAILAAAEGTGTTTPVALDILGKHVTLKKVYDVVESARKLRAFLPVIRYTLNTSIEDVVEADAYLNAYNRMLASLDSLVAIVMHPLLVAKEGFYSTLKGGVRGLAASYTDVKEFTIALAINQEAELGELITTMLNKFSATLADVDNDAVTVATSLQRYLDAIEATVTISDSTISSITESKLIGALVHTLIDSGPYSRYCFHKYKDLVTDLLHYLLEESTVCIDRELPRLGNLAPAVQSILDVNAIDFEDIYDWLTICDELQESAHRSECVTRITQSYTTLGEYFVDKYELLFYLTTTEVNASKQRVKICIDLSRRWLSENVYEMNRLVFAFGIVCFLQGLAAEPRPEFGLTNTISGSDRITLVKTAAATINGEIKALTVTAITSGFTPLLVTKSQIETIITKFGKKTDPILAGYDTLLGNTGGNAADAFEDFVVAIDAAVSYIENDLISIVTELDNLDYKGITDQLTDAFTRIFLGLKVLKAKSSVVEQGLTAALNSAGSPTVSADILRKFLPIRVVYDMLRSASNLRAYLPLVKYILQTTIENIKEADGYLAGLKSSLTSDVPTEAAKLLKDLEKITTEIEDAVKSDFTTEETNSKAAADISALTNIKSASDIAKLSAAANTLSGLFTEAALSAQTSAMMAAFDKISSSASSLITQLSTVDVLDNELVKQLINTLLGNDEYGRYCYNKYKDLVESMLDQGFDGGWQCVDKEYERLEYLKSTLGVILDLMAYDYEDFSTQVNVCESITSSPANLNSCVTAAENYNEMNRLVLAFGIVCFLQGLSAEPRPEFGLTNTISGSDRITLVKTAAAAINDEIKALTVPAIASGFTPLVTTKTQIETVIAKFGEKTDPILTGYDTLLADESGDIEGAFASFNTAIDGAISYIEGDLIAIIQALDTLMYKGIADQLIDAFGRIRTGLQNLKAKSSVVEQGLTAALNDAGSATVSADILREFLPMRVVYDMLRSASNLRAYLPLVKYILQTTIENIIEADGYLVSLLNILESGAENVYEMNRLVLAFGIVCFLQGLSAEPKPEFGLTNTISGSDRITLVKTAAAAINDEIKALTVPAIDSGFTPLVTTKTQIETVIAKFGEKTDPILAGYDTLLADESGDIEGAFASFNTAIDAAISYIENDSFPFFGLLTALDYTGIAEQLTDAFGRILLGLKDLKAKSSVVEQGLTAALNDAGSATVSADILRKFLPMRVVYDMLRSASNLRAYLPLVKYILQTTIENIIEADGYLVSLINILENGVNAESSQYAADIEAITTEIENAVASDFAGDNTNAQTVADLSMLTNIQSASDYSQLSTAANTLSGLFTEAALSAQTSAMMAAFDKISTSLTTRIGELQTGFEVLEFPLYVQLVNTLLGNDEYGRYCYNKYKDLGSALFDTAFDGAWQCVDKEYERLEYLKITLGDILDLMAYDYEDFSTQVNVCESITSSTANLNSCVTALANFYTEVFTATAEKIAVVFQLAQDEAVASENRILICIELVYLTTSVIESQKLITGLTTCSASGPTGAD
uniref:Uncharacterized protein n=1 Tax=Anopheles epiroticus TaxID=199890 RepID=A0A182P223_9DIPT